MHQLLWPKEALILPFRAPARLCYFPWNCTCNCMGIRSHASVQASYVCSDGCCMGTSDLDSSFGTRWWEKCRWQWFQNRWTILHFTRHSSRCYTWDFSRCRCAGWVYGFSIWIYFACLHIDSGYPRPIYSKFHQRPIYLTATRNSSNKAKLRWNREPLKTHGCWQRLHKIIAPDRTWAKEILTRSNIKISIRPKSRLDPGHIFRLDCFSHGKRSVSSKSSDLARITRNKQWRHVEHLDWNILEGCWHFPRTDQRF